MPSQRKGLWPSKCFLNPPLVSLFHDSNPTAEPVSFCITAAYPACISTPTFAATQDLLMFFHRMASYTVKWQRAMTEVTLTGVIVISCTFDHKGLTGWKIIMSCQVWILWCFKLPEIPQRTCYFLCRLLLSCFNSMKDETFCSLSHLGSCTLWHCCAARCVPRTPFPTHPAQPYRWGAPRTPSPRTAASLSPHEPRRVGFSWQDHVVQASADHGAVWAVLMILKTKQDVRLRVHLHIQSNRTQDKRREGFF